MESFDFQLRTRVVFGARSSDRLGEFVKEFKKETVLLVTDNGIRQAGHVQGVLDSLANYSIKVVVFDAVKENPDCTVVEHCVETAKNKNIDLIVGLGGGSSMDTAKATNFILTNGGVIEDYWGTNKASKPMLPMIAIPTTAGTGSEMQSYALISQTGTHKKMACGDSKAMPILAILDPELTVSQPKDVALATAIDAMAHALESAVTTRRTQISDLFSRNAFRLIMSNVEKILSDPSDREARGNLLLGSAYAGVAIENSMLGAAHSAANPLTAQFGIVHGKAVGISLPWVVRFNSAIPHCKEIYYTLAKESGIAEQGDSLETGVEKLVNRLEKLLDVAKYREVAKRYEIERDAIPKISKAAKEQWTANFNPNPIGEKEFAQLYMDVLFPKSA